MRRASFAQYVTAVTAMAGVLIVLGIYTAATGAGLACAQQWPLCDGGVLPQSVPSFVEWFHRLWAMLTGFAIFGTAAWAYRVGSRRTVAAAGLAAVLTPMQAIFGAVTVTLDGAIPGGYSAPVHAAHFLTGASIFTLLAYATLQAREDAPSARTALRVAALGTVAGVLLSRGVGLVAFSPAVQSVFFLVGVATIAAFVAAGRRLAGRRRLLVVVAGVGWLVTLLLGRDLLFYNELVRLANNVVAGGTAAIVAALALTEPAKSTPDRDRQPADD